MRKVFFDTFKNLIKENKNIIFLTADLGIKLGLNGINPRNFINVGIAEANMIGIAAGLSMSGKNVYCYSIIPFLTMRTFEQIRIDLCYNNLNVKLLGAGGGLVYGTEGMTHHAIEDIAIMRALPNMTIVAPGDAIEAEALAKASVSHQRPLYIRFGRDSDPIVHENGIDFKIGKGIVVKEGKNICLIATGTMLSTAKSVLDILRRQGLNATLISMHTIKPLDVNLIQDCAKKYENIFAIEEHSILGGLGGAVAEVLAEFGYRGLFKRIGIPDTYCLNVGGPDFLREKFGLTKDKIINVILRYYEKVK